MTFIAHSGELEIAPLLVEGRVALHACSGVCELNANELPDETGGEGPGVNRRFPIAELLGVTLPAVVRRKRAFEIAPPVRRLTLYL